MIILLLLANLFPFLGDLLINCPFPVHFPFEEGIIIDMIFRIGIDLRFECASLYLFLLFFLFHLLNFTLLFNP